MPPLSNVISPRGQTVYTDISISNVPVPGGPVPAALVEFAGRVVRSFLPIAGPDGKTTGTLYVEQCEHIGNLAQVTKASRLAYLTAPYSESK